MRNGKSLNAHTGNVVKLSNNPVIRCFVLVNSLQDCKIMVTSGIYPIRATERRHKSERKTKFS